MTVFRIGQLVPTTGQRPTFAQMYIYDVQNETANRLAVLPGLNASGDRQTLEQLQAMLRRCNPYVRVFKQAQELMESNETTELKVQPHCLSKDGRLLSMYCEVHT